MALLVGIQIYRPWITDIVLGRNRIGSILRIDVFSDCLGTIGFIAKEIKRRLPNTDTPLEISSFLGFHL